MGHNLERGHEVKDPAGHIKIAAGILAVSAAFYTRLFGELGYTQISTKPTGAAWVTPTGFGIWIAQAEVPDYEHVHSSPGLHHLCLKAASPEVVDAVHVMATEQHARIFAPPQSYPQYTESYYATFFADPDGMKLEVASY